MNFPPLLILVIIWVLMGLASSKKKKTQQQTAKNVKPGAAKPDAKAKKDNTSKTAPAQPQAEPARPTVLQPSISVTEHDDSVYQGSLYANTGEGYDPCHDEQLSSLSAAERETPSVDAEETPGLQLGWSGSDIVRGFVMSEILKRKERRAS